MSNPNLSPRQFGPGGKYTTKPTDLFGYEPGSEKYVSRVEAVHTGSGKRIGYLSIDKGKDTPAIHELYVTGPQRRKGVASQMLSHARDIYPDLQHSTALHPDGAAFAKARP